jgi:hypothetical protein
VGTGVAAITPALVGATVRAEMPATVAVVEVGSVEADSQAMPNAFQLIPGLTLVSKYRHQVCMGPPSRFVHHVDVQSFGILDLSKGVSTIGGQ